MVRVIAGLWRWRRNPLRRTTDLLEAWVALAALLVIVLGGGFAGLVAGSAAHDALQRSVRAQAQQRHQVWATPSRAASRPSAAADPEAVAGREMHRRVEARWTAPDGSEHSGPVAAPGAVRAGERFRIWTDARGRVVPRPMDASTARAHAVLAGLGAAAFTGAVAAGGRELVTRRMLNRRYRRWDREWERAGQDWGRAGAGS
ncbi:Rv1733c family protein [Streptomyces chrestomyceticus]|uniref:Rv1733c family protein n=1 Tax=Streptomyces chrestomyceticus TaxID=68185 RepID=UPI0005197FFA